MTIATTIALEMLRPATESSVLKSFDARQTLLPEEPSEQLRTAADWHIWDIIGKDKRFDIELFAARTPRLATELHKLERELKHLGHDVQSFVPETRTLDDAHKFFTGFVHMVLRGKHGAAEDIREHAGVKIRQHLEHLRGRFDPARICVFINN